MTDTIPAPRKRRSASAVTSNRRVFVEGTGDGSTRWARRWRDLCANFAADLGGSEHLSEAQASLIRRASTLSVQLESMEASLSVDQPIDLDLYNRAAGGLRRILESLGLERRSRTIMPTLAEYIDAKKVDVE